MKEKMHSGFWLDFRRVFSRRVSGNAGSLCLELVIQPIVVAALVFVAFLHRDKVDPYRLNFLYFSTLYAFWIGLFGACQAVNSEVRSGEWCYWVLGMGRNRTAHVLAVWASCLLFAFLQCIVFLSAVVASASAFSSASACGSGGFNPFTDMFVSVPGGEASLDPIPQMNGALWFVLSARWGALGPLAFATGLFALSLFAALLSGSAFGLLFGAFFREPATSLNISVGFVVLLGMVSYCGLRGDGTEKVDALFAPLGDGAIVRATMGRENFASNAVPASAISYILPQRYFFNIGRTTFQKDWSDERRVQESLREKFADGTAPCEKGNTDNGLVFRPYWTTNDIRVNFGTNYGILPWIKGFEPIDEVSPPEMVAFLRKHPEHCAGWKVALHLKILLATILLESLPLLLLDVLCLTGALLSVWKKPCYGELR